MLLVWFKLRIKIWFRWIIFFRAKMKLQESVEKKITWEITYTLINIYNY